MEVLGAWLCPCSSCCILDPGTRAPHARAQVPLFRTDLRTDLKKLFRNGDGLLLQNEESFFELTLKQSSKTIPKWRRPSHGRLGKICYLKIHSEIDSKICSEMKVASCCRTAIRSSEITRAHIRKAIPKRPRPSYSSYQLMAIHLLADTRCTPFSSRHRQAECSPLPFSGSPRVYPRQWTEHSLSEIHTELRRCGE